MTWDVRKGDCLDGMRGLDANSIDAIVTDPPYGLSFMGKDWDHGVPGEAFWSEALRVAKPGAHLLAFGGTRTYHRLACAIEDAGWEMRDCLSWLYGSGFPKSLNVQQAMNKAARGFPQGGADPESPNHGKFKGGCTDQSPDGRGFGAGAGAFMREQGDGRGGDEGPWHGWGTALKPAWEPILMARKPLIGTVAANVTQFGTGGLNVGGCRIVGPLPHHNYGRTSGAGFVGKSDVPFNTPSSGRWPANVCLDEEAAALVGESSRFFYCAKASRSEREAGLEGMAAGAMYDRDPSKTSHRLQVFSEDGRPDASTKARNHHPTVKPLALMRWLCRLVTPPGGLVLDPFTGSGTTGCAAVLESFRFLGFEREAEYVEIARRRIAHHTPAQLEAIRD